MKKSIKKAVSVITAAATLAVSVASMTANAVIINRPNEFILNHAVGAPSSELQTSVRNYAVVPISDPALTITCTKANTNSNVLSCKVQVDLRKPTEEASVTFSYVGQRKDVALQTRTTNNIYFNASLVKVNSSQGYGNCNFIGTAY